jgi:hypothetical protein
LVRRKLERARTQLGKRGAAAVERLDEAGRALDRHEPLAANRLVNLLLDEKR